LYLVNNKIRILQCFGHIAEQSRHFGGRFKIELVGRKEEAADSWIIFQLVQPVLVIEIQSFLYANKDVARKSAFFIEVVIVVGGKIRNVMLFCEGQQGLVNILFILGLVL